MKAHIISNSSIACHSLVHGSFQEWYFDFKTWWHSKAIHCDSWAVNPFKMGNFPRHWDNYERSIDKQFEFINISIRLHHSVLNLLRLSQSRSYFIWFSNIRKFATFFTELHIHKDHIKYIVCAMYNVQCAMCNVHKAYHVKKLSQSSDWYWL